MTKEDKAAMIAALVANEHNTLKDATLLEGLAEPVLQSLSAACGAAAALKAAAGATGSPSPGSAPGPAPSQPTGPAPSPAPAPAPSPAPKPATEEEFMAMAPESIRNMVGRFKAAESAQKDALVGKLKAAQAVYSEEKLKAMSLEQLQEVAALLKVDTAPAQTAQPAGVDFSGRFARRGDAAADNDLLNPPDGYKAAIEARNASAGKATVN